MYGVFLNQCGHKSCLARGFCSFDEAQQWIEDYRRFWEANFDRLDDYLKQLQTKQQQHDDPNPPCGTAGD